MAKVIRYMPELEGDEQLHIATLMTDMNEEQAENFAHVYRQRKKDASIVLITNLLVFIGLGGLHRFYLGQIGMGLLYLFTAGLCFIGSIVDAFNYKQLAYQHNREQADEVAALIYGAFPIREAPKQLPEDAGE